MNHTIKLNNVTHYELDILIKQYEKDIQDKSIHEDILKFFRERLELLKCFRDTIAKGIAEDAARLRALRA